MNDMFEAMQGVKLGLSLFSEALGLAKDVKDALPESGSKDAIEKSIAEADKAARIAEAQIANALGYKLCKCTFPPQIMLSNGYKEKNYSYEEEHICPKCNKSSITPPTKPINIPDTNRF